MCSSSLLSQSLSFRSQSFEMGIDLEQAETSSVDTFAASPGKWSRTHDEELTFASAQVITKLSRCCLSMLLYYASMPILRRCVKSCNLLHGFPSLKLSLKPRPRNPAALLQIRSMNAYPPSIHHRVQVSSRRTTHMHNQYSRYVDIGFRLASRANWTE